MANNDNKYVSYDTLDHTIEKLSEYFDDSGMGDTKVTQTKTDDDGNHPILIKSNTDDQDVTSKVLFDSGITINPNSNSIIAENFVGKATSADKLANKTNISIKNGKGTMATGAFDGSEDIEINLDSLDASTLTVGTVPLSRLPQGALERIVDVANEAARFALTTEQVQIGDTVRQLDTGIMYIVVDEGKLNRPGGYLEYAAGTAVHSTYADTLTDSRNLGVNLNSVNDEGIPFNGSEDQLNIPVTGTLGVSNGGTGAKNATEAWENLGGGSVGKINTNGNANQYLNGAGNWQTISTEDEKTKQTNTAAAAEYPILLKNGTGAGEVTNSTLFDEAVTINPSTNTVTASNFKGNLTGNASTATSATTATSADALTNSRKLGVALGTSSTAGADFDGNANQLNIPVSGVLNVANGGTGQTSWTNGGLIYAAGTATLGQITSGTGALYRTSSTVSPSYGTLPVGQGGTGQTSYNQYGVLYASGTTTLASTANNAGALYRSSTTSNPTFGTLPVAQGGTGTTAGGYTAMDNLNGTYQFTLNCTANYYKTFVKITKDLSYNISFLITGGSSYNTQNLATYLVEIHGVTSPYARVYELTSPANKSYTLNFYTYLDSDGKINFCIRSPYNASHITVTTLGKYALYNVTFDQNIYSSTTAPTPASESLNTITVEKVEASKADIANTAQTVTGMVEVKNGGTGATTVKEAIDNLNGAYQFTLKFNASSYRTFVQVTNSSSVNCSFLITGGTGYNNTYLGTYLVEIHGGNTTYARVYELSSDGSLEFYVYVQANKINFCVKPTGYATESTITIIGKSGSKDSIIFDPEIYNSTTAPVADSSLKKITVQKVNAAKADTATKADTLTNSRNLGVALGTSSTTGASFNGGAHQLNIPVSGVLNVANGGTGKSSWEAGGVVYTTAAGFDQTAKAAGALYKAASGNNPVFGTLPVAHGGTGVTTGGYTAMNNLGGAYQFGLSASSSYYRTFVKTKKDSSYSVSFLITGGSRYSAQNLATYLVEIHGVDSPYARVYELTPPSNRNYTLKFYTYLDSDGLINFCMYSIGYVSYTTITVLGGFYKTYTTFDETIYNSSLAPTPGSGTLNEITIQKVEASKADTLTTSRNLGVSLETSNTTGAAFDGSSNQLSIPVSGTLNVANGGTGVTTGGYAAMNNLGGAYQFPLMCSGNFYQTFVKIAKGATYNCSFLITGGGSYGSQNLATYLVEIHGVTSPYARVYELTSPASQDYTLNFYTYLDSNDHINFCIRSVSSASFTTIVVLGNYNKNYTTFASIYSSTTAPTPGSGSLNTITVQKIEASKADTLTTSRNLGVALGTSSTIGASFNGSANQLSIPVSGTLKVTNGGTGATTAKDAIDNLNGAYQFISSCASNYYRTFVKMTNSQSYNTSFLITGGSRYNTQNLATYLVEIHGTTSPYARVYELTSPTSQSYTLNFYTYLDSDGKINFCMRSPSYASYITVTVLGNYTKSYITFDTGIYNSTTAPTPGSGSLNTITVQKIEASKATTAGTANTWTAARMIAGASINGSANVTWYGTCATAASTAAKTTTITNSAYPTSGDPTTGTMAYIKFTNSNTVSNPTLQVGSTTAKSIKRYGTTSPGTTADTSWQAGQVVGFIYDGTYWQMIQ